MLGFAGPTDVYGLNMVRSLVLLGLVGLASAFAPAPRLARSVSLSAEKVDYASMDVDTLEKEIEGARRKLLDLRLEKRQQSKRSNFKSSEVRELKAKVARIMPFYEAKASAGGPLDAKRAQAKERQANKKETVEA